MTDNKKPDQGKPDQGKPSDKGTADKSVDANAAKRPHATIDLKATDVSAKTVDAKPANPSSTASASTSATGSIGAAAAAASAAKAAPAAASQSATQSANATASKTTFASPVGKPTAAPASGGFFTHAASGVAGALVALIATTAFGPMLGLMGDPSTATATAETRALTERLAALEKAPARAAAGASVPADIAQKLAAAEARIAKMEETAKSVATLSAAQAKFAIETQALDEKITKQSAVSDVGGRIGKLEEQLGAIAAAASDPARTGRVPQLAQITGKLADLEAALGTATGSLRKDIVKDVEARLAAATDASEAAKAGTLRIDRDVGALKSDATRLTQKAQTLEQGLKTVSDDAGGLKTALDLLKADLETRMKAASKPADVAAALAPVATKLTALEQNIQGVVKSEQDRNANAERIVLSLELANLRRALDRGGKYTSELAALKKVAGDKLNVKVLETAQNDGVPGLQALGVEFRPLTYTMLDADSEPDNMTTMERLMSGAKSVVRVRRVDFKPEDKSTEAVIARIEQGVKEGRLNDVLEESKRLSPKAIEPAKGWLAKIEARYAIDKALGELEAQLKTSLAGGPPGLTGGKTDLQKGTN
jgi:hypothetical protein